ncbi:MAG: sulfatase [Candidatus Brocadiia bacterium]
MSLPNILYLHSHDTGRYIEPFGHDIPAPNLSRLAKEGVLFRQLHCSCPTCSPSRGAMLTGQSAHSSGMLGLAHRGFRLNDYSQHILSTLRGAGYHSSLIGAQHIAEDADSIGYDEIVDIEPGGGEAICEGAESFFENPPEEPFFVSVGYATTHRKYAEPSGKGAEDPRYCCPPPPLPDTPETRYDMASYKASARKLDAEMGRVLKALDQSAVADETLVICTTDHGIAFPYMKCNLTDHGTGVFMIMRGPGGFEGGRVLDSLLSHVDLFPTLCDLLEIQPPDWLEGKSFMPIIRGETEEINDAIFTEVTFHAAYEPQRAVRTRRFKYIRRFGEMANRRVLANCDGGPSKNVWIDSGWADRPVDEEQLYDLTFDPAETNNLAGEEEMGEVLDEMRGRLDRWMEETDDPLLEGEVPPPPGACVTPPDSVSAGQNVRTVPKE